MPYIDYMQQITRSAFSRLYRDLDSVVFTDFPDYANVGDSAIALGNLAYWKTSGITVSSTYSLTTLSPRVYSSHDPVVINGGGNLGGLYPPISAHRYALAERLLEETMLIQAPQSVHFVSDQDRDWFKRSMSTRSNLRVAVRDTRSESAIGRIAGEVLLSPDAAHILGPIDSPPPLHGVVFLARRDNEAASAEGWPDQATVDWPRDPMLPRLRSWIRWRLWRFLPAWKAVLNVGPNEWESLANRRLSRGLNLLAAGEVIVTDRLHAMLLALQMGRRVIAIDNNNRKLSGYASTWFGSAEPPLMFANDLEDAKRILRATAPSAR